MCYWTKALPTLLESLAQFLDKAELGQMAKMYWCEIGMGEFTGHLRLLILVHKQRACSASNNRPVVLIFGMSMPAWPCVPYALSSEQGTVLSSLSAAKAYSTGS